MRVAPRHTTHLQKVARAAIVGAFALSLVFAPLVSLAQESNPNLPTATPSQEGVVVSSSPSFPKSDSGITEADFRNLAAECYGGDESPAVWEKCVMVAKNGDEMRCEQTALSNPRCVFRYKDGSDPWIVEPKFWADGLKGGTVDESGQVAPTNSSDRNSCNLFAGGNILTCIQDVGGKIGASILWVFVSVFAMLLGLVGGILNWVMLITVFQYSTYFGNSEGMLVAWTVLRDIGNIVLLFGFIFIGLQTILNLGHFSVGKALPRLIIFAILINFSLFVSEAIVDVSNVFSSTLYTQASQTNCSSSENMESCANDGIAGKIMKEAGMAGIFGAGSDLKTLWSAQDGADQFYLYFGMLILIIIMLVVFIAAVILFLIRAVVLMILLVTSPLGFAAMAIPQFEEYSKMWWNKLISNAFFAPVFLLMMLVGLKIMDGAHEIFNAGGAGLTVAIAKGSTGTGGVFILFFLIIGFMIAALMSAKSLGAMGASFAVDKAGRWVGNTSGRFVGAGTFGVAGFVGRRTLGRASNWAYGKVASSDFNQEHPGLARLALGATDYGRKASYDARSTAPVKAGAGLLRTELGEPGKTAKHGYHGIEEKATDARVKEQYKNMKPTKKQAAAAEANKILLEEARKERTELLKKFLTAITEQQAKVADAQATYARDASEANKNALKAQQDVLETTVANYADASKNSEQSKRFKELEKRQKALEAIAKQQMTDTFINVGLQGTWYPPGSVGGHADHEAAEKIRKEASMSALEKALKGVKDEVEKQGNKDDDHGHDDDHGKGSGTTDHAPDSDSHKGHAS